MRKPLFLLAVLLGFGLFYFEIISRIDSIKLEIPESQSALLLLDCSGAPCPGKTLKSLNDLADGQNSLFRQVLDVADANSELHFFVVKKRELDTLKAVRFCFDAEFASTEQMFGRLQFAGGEQVWLSFLSTNWNLAKAGFIRHGNSDGNFVPCGPISKFNLFKFARRIERAL